MGYPMSYARVVARNALLGNYGSGITPMHMSVSGDLRRLEQDQRDARHLRLYADKVGITEEQVKHVLDLFFGDKNLYAYPLRWDEDTA